MMPLGAPRRGYWSISFTTLSTTGQFVPEVGFEPTLPCEKRILSPLRLPLRHSGIKGNQDLFLSSRVCRVLSQIAAFMAPNFQKSVPIGHGESILFIYRVLFAVHIRRSFMGHPKGEEEPSAMERLCIRTVDPAHFTQPKRQFFRHTGHHINLAQLVFETIPISALNV